MSRLRRFLASAVALMLLVGISTSSFAFATTDGSSDGSTTNNTSSTSPSPSPTPTTPPPPVGPCGTDYVYNSKTGLWDGQYFTYSSTTKVFTPITPVTYDYDASTGTYNASEWICNSRTGNYDQTTVNVTEPPSGAIVENGPDQSSDPSSSDGQINDPEASGPGNNTDSNSTNDLSDNNNNNLGVGTTVNGVATTGNASVDANTNAGDATSGDANNITNVENLLMSSSSLSGAQTFVANINGDVDGDLLINPTGSADSNTTTSNGVTVNNDTGATVDNNITLNATSGDANVSEDTNAGNATSGSADSVANVVNMIDSMITANQSFIGVININGDLNGNIVVPPQFVNSLIADNVPSTTLNTSEITNNNVTTALDNSNNQAITNNITTTAKSGAATIADDTNAGSATSGPANTNVTIFNLTGDQVVASNTLLVFVNVLGNWVGLLMNAPAGTTAAAFGGGITSDTNTATTDINNSNKDDINNNINVSAESGNATVSKDTTAGNATTGSATSSVNLLNLIDSQFNLSGWFGVLFINVYGTWDGSFGAQTPVTTANSSSNGSSTNNTSSNAQLLKFVGSKTDSDTSPIVPITPTTINDLKLTSDISGSAANPDTSKTVAALNKSADKSRVETKVIAAIAIVFGLLLFVYEHHLTAKRAKRFITK
jgi:hypothetical protein